jgi:hypothetical protein
MIDGPSGELLLTDSVNNGTVFLLDNNGKSKKKLISALDRPYGIEFWTGRQDLFVRCRDHVAEAL